ncbi:creatininase family protein [Clostridiaceae bacterium HSG29]|nr:creatininase family protein [Clostridiaceae bacterium HSG29]
MNKALILEELTWVEFDAVKDQVELVIIPLGSTEQHGPNTTLATDTVRARAMGKLIGEEYGNRVLIGPTLPIGLAYHHMKFPGTMTFSLQTYIQVIRDICWSFNEHGFKKILFITGHGGNKRPVHEYATEARKEFGMDIYISSMGGSLVRELSAQEDFTKVKGHACEVETSQTMFLAPDHVRPDALEAAKFIEGTKYLDREHMYDCGMFWDFSKVSENGALGDATRASVEFGEKMNALVVEKIKKFIDNIIL